MKISQIILYCINLKFLQKLDKNLLLNNPRIWVTKIHYVLIYGLIANLILNLLVIFLIQDNQIDEFVNIIIPLVMLAEVGVFIYWFYQQISFNIEQEYGNTHYFYGFLEVVLYSFCTFIIISSSLTMTWTAINEVAKSPPIITATNVLPNSNSSDFAQWRGKFCTKYDTKRQCNDNIVGNIFEDIQEFITNDINQRTYRLPYDYYWWFHTIFTILGVFILMMRKHNNWYFIVVLLVSIILLTIITIILLILFNRSDIDILGFIDMRHYILDRHNSYSRAELYVRYFQSKNVLGMLLLIVIFTIKQSFELLKEKIFNQFQYINFLVVPFAVGSFFMFWGFISDSGNNHTMKESSLLLIKLFIVYLLFVPLQKWIFIRTQSLPKK